MCSKRFVPKSAQVFAYSIYRKQRLKRAEDFSDH